MSGKLPYIPPRRVVEIVMAITVMSAVVVLVGRYFERHSWELEYPEPVSVGAPGRPIASEADVFRISHDELGVLPAFRSVTSAHVRSLDMSQHVRFLCLRPTLILCVLRVSRTLAERGTASSLETEDTLPSIGTASSLETEDTLPSALKGIVVEPVEGRTGPGDETFYIALRTSDRTDYLYRQIGTRTFPLGLRRSAPDLTQYPCTSCHQGQKIIGNGEVPPVAVPLPMLDPEPSVVPGVGAS